MEHGLSLEAQLRLLLEAVAEPRVGSPAHSIGPQALAANNISSQAQQPNQQLSADDFRMFFYKVREGRVREL